jgi:hypothetical protein
MDVEQNEYCLEQKGNKIYNCLDCNYTTYKKNHYNRHLSSNKHILNMSETTMKLNENQIKFGCDCGTIFNSKTTLWRHKKTCSHKNELQNTKQMLAELLKQNNDIRNKLLQLTSLP